MICCVTSVLLLHCESAAVAYVTFGMELLDACFGGPMMPPPSYRPHPTSIAMCLNKGQDDRLPTAGNPSCFWWPCTKVFGCWAASSNAIFALRITGEMTVGSCLLKCASIAPGLVQSRRAGAYGGPFVSASGKAFVKMLPSRACGHVQQQQYCSGLRSTYVQWLLDGILVTS